MSPARPAIAEAQAPFTQKAENTSPSQEQAIVKMGRYQVHNARPLKNTQPDKDGQCFYLLKCYEIGEEALPKDILAHEFDADRMEPTYILYYGHISTRKGEAGLVIGYVYDCLGNETLTHSAFNSKEPTMVAATGTMMPRLRFAVDFDNPRSIYTPLKPEYGPYQDIVAGIDEHIAINRVVNEARHPRPKARTSGLGIVSGKITYQP